MGNWNDIYSHGKIHKTPSEEIVKLVPLLKLEGVHSVLDAGCGTGRHSQYLAQQGFDVHGIDISERAIQLAESNQNFKTIHYRVGTLINLPFSPCSMDFILANHSLEYASDEDIKKSVLKLDSILKKGKLFFVRVPSKQHLFYKATPEEVYGFSHIGFCIKNNIPVHFFDREELRDLFKNYKIDRLEHLTHEVGHDKISVPLREWVFLGHKK
jgi:SAM-dependent methyltransferase